jgi:hypothetical protein
LNGREPELCFRDRDKYVLASIEVQFPAPRRFSGCGIKTGKKPVFEGAKKWEENEGLIRKLLTVTAG